MKDTQIKKLIEAEKKRQKKVINLIASENYVSRDVLEALGSELVNKYAEGYPGKRYYGGNEIVDKVEELCMERALKTFGLSGLSTYSQGELARGNSPLLKSSSTNAQNNSPLANWHVNVQPLSGSSANTAVYLALVPVGGKIMGMSLDHGGHLTHGHKVSISGKVWQQIPFGLSKETEMLDYVSIKELALKEKPAIIVAGFTAYPRIIDWKKFRDVADSCGAYLMVDMSHIAGLVAGGVYPSPFEYADIVTTTTHKTLRGPRAALIFSKIDEREIYKKIDRAVFPGIQGGPHENQIAAVAVALKEASTPAFKKYAKQVVKNSEVLAEDLKSFGWKIISGGTDSHLILIDTWNGGVKNVKGAGAVTGKDASDRLEKAGIIVNKNAIPFDTRPPADPSGIRLGTAAETTRGRKEKDFHKIAKTIDKILKGE